MHKPALLATLLLASPALAGDAIVVPLINETESNDGWWSSIINPGSSPSFSFTALHQNIGGNPDGYRAFTHASGTGPASGAVVHNHRTSWTPLVNGPILAVDMSVDVNCFSGGTSNAIAFGLIVTQSGVTYFGPTFTALNASGWRSDLQATGLTALSFTTLTGGLHPDFGPTGGVTSFGVYTGNGTGISTPISSSGGIDNFVVTITTLPQLATPCGPADIGRQGGFPGADGALDNNDFIAFINSFFAQSPAADYGRAGGFIAPDGLFDNNDFIAFIDHFFLGCDPQ